MKYQDRYLAYFMALAIFSSGTLAYSSLVKADTAGFCLTAHWVGGSGSFSQLSHWASNSGGSGGMCIRTNLATNHLIFDSNSGSGTVTQDIPDLMTGPLSMAGSSITISIANGTTWRIAFGFTDPGTAILANAMNVVWVLLFFSICGIIIFGAWKIRQHFGGD